MISGVLIADDLDGINFREEQAAEVLSASISGSSRSITPTPVAAASDKLPRAAMLQAASNASSPPGEHLAHLVRKLEKKLRQVAALLQKRDGGAALLDEEQEKLNNADGWYVSRYQVMQCQLESIDFGCATYNGMNALP